MPRKLFLLLALSIWLTPANAFDFNAALTDFEGKPLLEGQTEVTLSRVIVAALLTPYQDEQNLAGEEKVKRFLLAVKVRDSKEPQLTADEIALVKKLVSKLYSPLIVGKVWEILDPPSMLKK